MLKTYQKLQKKVLFFLFTVVCSGLFVSVSAQINKRSVDFTSSNLPIVIIETQGQTIPDDNPRIIADMGIIFNGSGQRNNVGDSLNNYSGKISIEIRGQSSSGWDKKAYGFETQNEDGSNLNVSLLGLPEENDWVLYAPFFDRSLMRNVLTYQLAGDMGMYASRTVYCELVLNGEYRGIYVLMEKIKRDKNRVDIAKLEPDEIEGDDITGGYILCVDKDVAIKKGVNSLYPPHEGDKYQTMRYQYVYPDADDIVTEQEDYITGFMNEFEILMHDGDYSDPVDGYNKYLDVNSFIDYLILNELSRNVDGYRLSAYMYKEKDSDGGKLCAGPVWDYNFSYGNVAYFDAGNTNGWQLLFFAEDDGFIDTYDYKMPFWWKVLFSDGEFISKLNSRWQELRNDILSVDYINSKIDQFADTTAEAHVRNFEIWPKPGDANSGGMGWFPYDSRSWLIDSYSDEVEQTKLWIAERIEWMDENIPLITSVENNRPKELPVSFQLMQNFPNPFNPATTISFNLPKRTNVNITVYDILGRNVATVIDEFKSAGSHSVIFNAAELPSGIYFYTIKTKEYSETKKMTLLR